MNNIPKIIRWTARSLSAAILLFWGWFIAAHLLGGNEPAPRPLVARDYVAIAAMLASLAGLALAWWRERAGASLTLAAVALGAGLNWRMLLSPAILIPLDALLFLALWWITRPPAPDRPAG